MLALYFVCSESIFFKVRCYHIWHLWASEGNIFNFNKTSYTFF